MSSVMKKYRITTDIIEKYKRDLEIGQDVIVEAERNGPIYTPGDDRAKTIEFVNTKIRRKSRHILCTDMGWFQYKDIYKWNVLIPELDKQAKEEPD